MEALVPEDVAVEHPGPERAFCIQVCGIEDDHLTHHVHNVEGYQVLRP
jgi:hypothetical protein